MTRRLGSLRPLALFALATALAACGAHRPPAVAGGGATRPGGGAAPGRTAVEPVESGPDVRPLGDDGAAGVDLTADTGEGGPLTDIHYDFDKSALSDEARAILEKNATWLQAHRDTKARVEGHCDERGTTEYNLALGEQRAKAARDYLASLGVSADRLSTVSYGKERPVDAGKGEEAWARNRRAHFAVSR